MGACASMPKAMRGVNGGGPPPEPPKEEETTAAVTVPPKDDDQTANGTGKEETVGGGEKIEDEGGNDGAKPEDEKDKDGAGPSLGSLLETGEVKEPPRNEKIIPEAQTVPEEQKFEELSVSDKAAGEPAEKGVTPYVAPVARATEEDKET